MEANVSDMLGKHGPVSGDGIKRLPLHTAQNKVMFISRVSSLLYID